MAQQAADAAKAKKAEVIKAKVTGTYNEFDGLYHGTDGSLFDANGTKVTGVNIQLSWNLIYRASVSDWSLSIYYNNLLKYLR